jgi:hypothetical protein
MKHRLPIQDNLCTNPDNHRHHICQLRVAGRMDEVARLQEQPRFICNNCGAKSSSQGAVCAPGPLDQAKASA